MKELLRTLVEIPAPPGYEGLVRNQIREWIEPLVDEIRIDPLGNLLAVRNQANAPRLMLVAHMDEIGLMITHVDQQGFARFVALGGVMPIHCVGGRVRFLNGAQGVIGVEKNPASSEIPPLEKMFIDFGASSVEDCPVRVGDVAVFDRPFLDLGKRVVSKAMDDRVGVAVLIETLRRLEQSVFELYFVFSVQEEVGVRGATVAAFGVEPDLGLAVDVTATGDTPKGHRMEVRLGKGPAIKIRDAGMIADPRVVRWMIQTAEKAKIPYQREILEFGGTDARAIQLSRSGVPTGVLSIPCRYIHAPSEMVDMEDVENAVRLLLRLLRTSHPFELM
ncbi:MAG: M42 family metallopeptidase [Anaerolineales bacterium]|nr:M42 family metallopeptidase [Anaerolineales bacterium]MDW8161395.1 M42 family metallopeptidase [Anaerolineales bacterium]